MSAKHPNNDSASTEHVHHAPVDGGVGVSGVPTTTSDEPLFRDRVRWGPIVAGVLTALTTLVVMTVLGLAIGMTAFEPGETGERTVGTAAAIWGILSALLAFFLGGYVAGRNALASAYDNGALNGFLVGAATIVVMLWMVGAGVGNLLGLAGSNVDQIANVNNVQTAIEQPSEAGDAVTTTAQDNYDEARNSAWGTFIGLVIALGAATAGGALGHPDRAVVTTGATGRRTASAAR